MVIFVTDKVKLNFKPEPETWQRHPYVLTWYAEHDGQKAHGWDNDYLTDRKIKEMQEFLDDNNIQHSKFMMKDNYAGYGPNKYTHAGFRFLTEADATMFWLRFQGE